MWHLGPWFCDGLSSARLTAGLNILNVFSSLNGSMIYLCWRLGFLIIITIKYSFVQALCSQQTEGWCSYKALLQAGSAWDPGLCRILFFTHCYPRKNLRLYEWRLIYLVSWRSYQAQTYTLPISANETNDCMSGTLDDYMLVNLHRDFSKGR